MKGILKMCKLDNNSFTIPLTHELFTLVSCVNSRVSFYDS